MIVHVLEAASILLIVAIGALPAERSGVLNIALEGLITVGAFTMAAAVRAGAPVGVAIGVAVMAGLAASTILIFFALYLQANPFIVGLAINVLAAGAVPLLSQALFQTRGTLRFAATRSLATSPIAIALVLTGVVHLLLAYSVWGVRARAAGEQPAILHLHAIPERRLRAQALLWSGGCAAAAGALLALRLNVYLPNISAGRGWIALVVLYLGYRRAFGLAAAALFFGVVDAMAVRAQAVLDVPPTILLALPYLLTVIAFVSYAAYSKRRNYHNSRRGVSSTS